MNYLESFDADRRVFASVSGGAAVIIGPDGSVEAQLGDFFLGPGADELGNKTLSRLTDGSITMGGRLVSDGDSWLLRLDNTGSLIFANNYAFDQAASSQDCELHTVISTNSAWMYAVDSSAGAIHVSQVSRLSGDPLSHAAWLVPTFNQAETRIQLVSLSKEKAAFTWLQRPDGTGAEQVDYNDLNYGLSSWSGTRRHFAVVDLPTLGLSHFSIGSEKSDDAFVGLEYAINSTESGVHIELGAYHDAVVTGSVVNEGPKTVVHALLDVAGGGQEPIFLNDVIRASSDSNGTFFVHDFDTDGFSSSASVSHFPVGSNSPSFSGGLSFNGNVLGLRRRLGAMFLETGTWLTQCWRLDASGISAGVIPRDSSIDYEWNIFRWPSSTESPYVFFGHGSTAPERGDILEISATGESLPFCITHGTGSASVPTAPPSSDPWIQFQAHPTLLETTNRLTVESFAIAPTVEFSISNSVITLEKHALTARPICD